MQRELLKNYTIDLFQGYIYLQAIIFYKLRYVDPI